MKAGSNDVIYLLGPVPEETEVPAISLEGSPKVDRCAHLEGWLEDSNGPYKDAIAPGLDSDYCRICRTHFVDVKTRFEALGSPTKNVEAIKIEGFEGKRIRRIPLLDGLNQVRDEWWARKARAAMKPEEAPIAVVLPPAPEPVVQKQMTLL
ncbi:MAG TPA: hypothetical protein V6D29_21670 [Leptolyngbyaceae cyanobacterium]